MAASAELHPTNADDVGDNTAAGTPVEPAPQKRGRGRPKLLPGQKGKYTRKGKPAAQSPAIGGNEAADAIEDAAQEKRERDRERKRNGPAGPPKAREAGWLRQLIAETANGRAVSQLRHLALAVLEREGLPWAQEVLADPRAKDSDKARAVDLLAKLSAGYVTPDMTAGEDAPTLPAPIFEYTQGELPGEGAMAGALSEENGGADDDTAGPQLAHGAPPTPPAGPVAPQSVGPVPYLGFGAA